MKEDFIRPSIAKNSVLLDKATMMTPQHRSGALPPPPISEINLVLNSETLSVHWLAGDGSDRCYYRIYDISTDKSFVLMQLSGRDAEALLGNDYEWITMAQILEKNGIFIPKVIATLPDYAAIIIEDYGDLMLESYAIKYQNEILSSIVSDRYEIALKIYCKFLKIPKNENEVWCKRAFDFDRLKWELNFFKEKYLNTILGLNFSKSENKQFNDDIITLSNYLSELPQYFVHRDYHSRNLMVNKDFMAVLDFQDARLGPASYDLVSLIFDSYVPFPIEQRLSLLDNAFNLVEKKVSKEVSLEIKDSWKATLLQRQLKALGSFGYLTTEKNRGDYLKYCLPAIKTLIESDVKDSRWNFLSQTIPALMLKKVGPHSEYS